MPDRPNDSLSAPRDFQARIDFKAEVERRVADLEKRLGEVERCLAERVLSAREALDPPPSDGVDAE